MTDILQKQYTMVQLSREVVLHFIETEVVDGLNTPVPAYDNRTIRHLLEHNASCYFNWLAYFALKQPPGSLADTGFITVDLLRQLYLQVDEVMDAFLRHFNDDMETPVSGIHNRNGLVSVTPLYLFTHVITHEFHHKGQILSMCRLLGHIPPDTDVIRF
jgi:uncharacterized damage-inducible protein DinB